MNAIDALTVPELKPCPFCGGKARLCEASRDGWVVGAYVECDDCSASTKSFTDSRAVIEYRHNAFTGTDKLLAARAWNTRPGEATEACPECGIAVPHQHGTRINVFKPEYHNKDILVELLST